MSRKVIPFVVAFVLICLVMVVSGAFAFGGFAAAEKFASDTAWSASFSNAESMKVVDLTGDGQDALFIQSTQDISVFNGGGSLL